MSCATDDVRHKFKPYAVEQFAGSDAGTQMHHRQQTSSCRVCVTISI